MIHTEKPTRTFTAKKGKTIEAVKAIDLDVAEGELVAFLGPNGAGKSTTPAHAHHPAAADLGHARRSPGTTSSQTRRAVRARIGYVGQGSSAGHASGCATS